MNIHDVIDALKNHTTPVRIMEVCGTHTAAIAKNGLRSLVSPAISLVSGPGCPICVTAAAYIDRLTELAFEPSRAVLAFGDMMRVPGRRGSLEKAAAAGASVTLMYSPLQALALARNNPETVFIVAAVGFETTAPVYAVLLQRAIDEGLGNLRLLTSLKTMPAVLDYVCGREAVDAFLCPGHVAVVTGLEPFRQLAERYRKPFVIAGFEAEHILAALYEIIGQIRNRRGYARNMYGSVVSGQPQSAANALLHRFFMPETVCWRGIGDIGGSGLYLRPEFGCFDAGSRDIPEYPLSEGCRCADVMLGRMLADDCPLFSVACRPETPLGACMVSEEGACRIRLVEQGGA